MNAPRPVHMLNTATRVRHIQACNGRHQPFGYFTTEPAEVTCKSCLRKIARAVNEATDAVKH